MITVYGFTVGRASRALWALEEAGEPYAFVRLDPSLGEHRTEAYLALNPAGKVPTLVDGDFVLTESGAIVTWVADRHPGLGLAPPAGTPARAHYLQWCFFVLTELEQPLWTQTKHTFVLPPKLRVPQVIDTAKKEWSRPTAVLSAQLSARPFLLGEDFTMADVLAGHSLAWARSLGLPLGSDTLEAYADRVLGRPALARTTARERAGS